jgi:hypothetical protein
MPDKELDEELGAKEVEPEVFRGAPVPPVFPAHGEDVFWFARAGRASDREFDDMMLRRVPGPVAHRFRGAAGARGFTHAQYLAALVALHEAMRERADGGDAEMAATLDRLGLGTVSI